MIFERKEIRFGQKETKDINEIEPRWKLDINNRNKIDKMRQKQNEIETKQDRTKMRQKQNKIKRKQKGNEGNEKEMKRK